MPCYAPIVVSIEDIQRIEYDEPHASGCWEEFRITVGKIRLSIPIHIPHKVADDFAGYVCAGLVCEEAKKASRALVREYEQDLKTTLLDAAKRLETSP